MVAVGSGKGGVGKTTVAVNLAVALVKLGYRVGLLDADIYGPNVPMMLGQTRQPSIVDGDRIGPLLAHGVKFGHPFRLRIVGLRDARVTFRPRLETNPSVKITLSSVNPLTATDPIDTNLCPTPGTCVGEISGVDGDFAQYTNRTDPIVVVIIAKWGDTVPGSGIWMQKPAVNNGPLPAPIHLPACVINATTRAFNTACVLPEIIKSLTVNNVTTMTTYDTVLFTGNDPHFARR